MSIAEHNPKDIFYFGNNVVQCCGGIIYTFKDLIEHLSEVAKESVICNGVTHFPLQKVVDENTYITCCDNLIYTAAYYVLHLKKPSRRLNDAD